MEGEAAKPYNKLSWLSSLGRMSRTCDLPMLGKASFELPSLVLRKSCDLPILGKASFELHSLVLRKSIEVDCGVVGSVCESLVSPPLDQIGARDPTGEVSAFIH